jgi:hypothetical protein
LEPEETAIARERFGKHDSATTNTRKQTVGVFSMRSVPMAYPENGRLNLAVVKLTTVEVTKLLL